MDSTAPSKPNGKKDSVARSAHITPARDDASPARPEKKKPGSAGRTAMFVFVILIVLTAAGFNLNMSSDLRKAEKEAETLRKRIDLHKKEVAELREAVSLSSRQVRSARPSEEFIVDFIKKRNPRVPSIVAMEVAKNVLIYSEKNQIPPCLAVGVMEVESSYNPMAVSSKDAKGLMQVLYSAWREKIEDKYDLFEIDQNIRVGCEILSELLDKNPIDKTLYAYMGGVDGEYLKKILKVAVTFEIERVRQETSTAGQDETSGQQPEDRAPVADEG